MLLVTAIPLTAYIYSIERYSNFITNSDYENNRELFRMVLANTMQGKHRSSVRLVGDLVINDEDFLEKVEAGDRNEINDYLQNVRTEPFFEKSDVEITGLKIYDQYNNIAGAWDSSFLDESAIQSFLEESEKREIETDDMVNDTFELDVNGVPTYMMIIPIKRLNYEHKLVIIASVWQSLSGISNYVRADFEIRGMNDELLFREDYINAIRKGDLSANNNNLKKISEKISIGNNGGFVTMIAYVDDQFLEIETANLKYTAILVASVCLVIVWIIATYLLKVNLFSRIDAFSETMKNIVDGKPVGHLTTGVHDEFSPLTVQLQRVIDYNDERTRIREELENAIKQAEVANVAKSDFLANMSHELRTPLNAIIGFSEILANNGMENYSKDRTQEYATDIMVSGKHLLSIINDILDLSKVEAGKMRFYEDDVDIIEICETSMRVLRNLADDKGVTISIDTAEDFPLIKADERMIQQIMTNLLSNAVKFSLEGGDIDISVKLSESNDIVISVTDNGIGIAQNKIEDIMQPFHQIETSYAKTEVGTGLGLSLVKAFVEMHDGTVKIKSEIGKQTTVYVVLPGNRVVGGDQKPGYNADYKNASSV